MRSRSCFSPGSTMIVMTKGNNGYLLGKPQTKQRMDCLPAFPENVMASPAVFVLEFQKDFKDNDN